MHRLSVDRLSKRYAVGRSGEMPLPSILPRRLLRKREPLKQVWALRRVSFDVDPGTILGVIGPNGAGKSTLLRTIGRVTPPSSGRVAVRGRVVPLFDSRGGFQPHSTGRENVYINADLYGIPRPTVTERMDDIVEFAELEDFIDEPVNSYSSGMSARLAFSVAVNMSPDILLADEILAVGDLVFQERCLRQIQRSASQGMTVLFVSHDMSLIRRLCDRAIWLNAGELVADGEPNQVVPQYEESAWALIARKEKKGDGAGEHGSITSVKLSSVKGAKVNSLNSSHELFVDVTLKITTARVKVQSSIEFAAGGVVAFRTVEPKPTLVRKPGTYTISVRIPPHLLSGTMYTVKVTTSIAHQGTRTKLVKPDALVFRVHDPDLKPPKDLAGQGGVVHPRLEWQFGRDGSEAAG